MKNIKKAILIMIVFLIIFFPIRASANTIQEALNTQIGNESKQELSLSLLEICQEQIERQMAAIEQQVKDAKEESKKALEKENTMKKAQAIVNASYSVPSAGNGWCAAWVSQVYSAAGFGYPTGNACDMYWNYCTSSNKDDIMEGMIIAVPSHTGTYLGSIYGHIGIIVYHDGTFFVRQNVGPITEVTLDEWIQHYGTTYEPKWGFAANIGG